jgi:hypothetical protein
MRTQVRRCGAAVDGVCAKACARDRCTRWVWTVPRCSRPAKSCATSCPRTRRCGWREFSHRSCMPTRSRGDGRSLYCRHANELREAAAGLADIAGVRQPPLLRSSSHVDRSPARRSKHPCRRWRSIARTCVRLANLSVAIATDCAPRAGGAAADERGREAVRHGPRAQRSNGGQTRRRRTAGVSCARPGYQRRWSRWAMFKRDAPLEEAAEQEVTCSCSSGRACPDRRRPRDGRWSRGTRVRKTPSDSCRWAFILACLAFGGWRDGRRVRQAEEFRARNLFHRTVLNSLDEFEVRGTRHLRRPMDCCTCVMQVFDKMRVSALANVLERVARHRWAARRRAKAKHTRLRVGVAWCVRAQVVALDLRHTQEFAGRSSTIDYVKARPAPCCPRLCSSLCIARWSYSPTRCGLTRAGVCRAGHGASGLFARVQAALPVGSL